MPRNISQADIKLLWCRAGGRCTICRKELSLGDTGGIIGEMAHIVARSSRGQRSDSSYPRSQVDTYDNLILLCPMHHRQIDLTRENVGANEWPVGKLRSMKNRHEEWVRSALAGPSGISQLGTYPKCLFVLSGPSGAGKDVVIRRLINSLEANGKMGTNLRRFTTRKRRSDEGEDSPFIYLTREEFDAGEHNKRIRCVHTSLGVRYGCDGSFEASAGSPIFYSMRVYGFLPKLKEEVESCGIFVRNIFLRADQASITARILMRSGEKNEKLARIEESLRDLSAITDDSDFADTFFDLVVDNSDRSSLQGAVERIYRFVLGTMVEIDSLTSWWSKHH